MGQKNAKSQKENTVFYMVDRDIDGADSFMKKLFRDNKDAFGRPSLLCDLIDKVPKDKEISIVLTTNGGGVVGCEKILKKLLKHPAGYKVYIRNECFSAGTLIALGANEIIMNNDSYLGKIDPQKMGTFSTCEVIYATLDEKYIDAKNIYDVTEAQYVLNYMLDLLKLIFNNNNDKYKSTDQMKNIADSLIYSKLPHFKSYDFNDCKNKLKLNIRNPLKEEDKFFDKKLKVKDYKKV